MAPLCGRFRLFSLSPKRLRSECCFLVLENSGIRCGRGRGNFSFVFSHVPVSLGYLLNPLGRLSGLGGRIFSFFGSPSGDPWRHFGEPGCSFGLVWKSLLASGATLGAHMALLGPPWITLGSYVLGWRHFRLSWLLFGLPGPLPGALFPLVVSMAALLHSFGVPVVPLWPRSVTL